MVLGRAVANSQPSTPSWYAGEESVRTWLSISTTPASPAASSSPTVALLTATPQPPTETPTVTPTARATDTISPAALVSSVDVGSALPEGQAGVESSPTAPVGPQPAPRVLAVGDSVMVSAADQLSETIDGLAIDASIGRQMREVIEVLQDILDAGQMGDVVIVQVGNNGYLSEKKFDEMMLVLKDVRAVLILNCRVPRQWEATVNTVLADGVAKYSNATLVDWYAASADHSEFFWKDGMHLRPEGAEAYAELVADQVRALTR